MKFNERELQEALETGGHPAMNAYNSLDEMANRLVLLTFDRREGELMLGALERLEPIIRKVLVDDTVIGRRARRGKFGQMLSGVGAAEDVDEEDDVEEKEVPIMCGFQPAVPAAAEPAPDPGRKDDKGKDRWDLLPTGPVLEIVKVLGFGARKYAPNNWQKVSDGRERYYAAMMRHLAAWRMGERTDPESGLMHLSHAACCLTFLLWLEMRGKEGST